MVSFDKLTFSFLKKDIYICILKGLFHPAFLARVASWLTFSWPMKMATTKANLETTRARHAG